MSRKQERRRKRLERIQRAHQLDSQIPATQFIRHLTGREGNSIILLGRLTTDKDYQRRMDQQIEKAHAGLKRLGLIGQLIKTFSGVESYSIYEPRPILKKACSRALFNDAIVVALKRNRIIRSSLYDGCMEETEYPAADEFEALIQLADGAPLFTIEDPDDPNPRGQDIKRGQAATGNKGGRPVENQPGYKKQRWLTICVKAYLMSAVGMSLRHISECLDIPVMTVQNWIEKVKRSGLPPECCDGCTVSFSNPQGTIELKIVSIHPLRVSRTDQREAHDGE